MGPRPDLGFGAMRTILRPTVVGVNAARHLAWYLSYQISCRDQVR